MATQGIAEILRSVALIQDPLKRQDALASHGHNKTLIAILQYAFDPRVQFLLPKGIPPYKRPLKRHDLQGNLYREMRKMYLFHQPHLNISREKRQQYFIELIEHIDPDDGEMMIRVKDKEEPYDGITADLVRLTFPGLLPPLTAEEELGNVLRDGRTLIVTPEVAKILSGETTIETIIKKAVEKGKTPRKPRKLPVKRKYTVPEKKPCPYGCKSKDESGLYSPGPLMRHINQNHSGITVPPVEVETDGGA